MSEGPQQGVHSTELDASPDETLRRVAQAAEAWGGEWQRDPPERATGGGGATGRLILPVSAGVRRGWMGYLVSARERSEDSERTRLELRLGEEHLNVDRATVVFLLTALVGALLFLVVPFVPRLMPLLPVGFVLTAAGWLVVASRLRNSGVEEFLGGLASSDPREGETSG